MSPCWTIISVSFCTEGSVNLQITIDGVQTGNDPACQPNEQPVGCQILQPEDALFAGYEQVEHESQVCVHGIDDAKAGFEVIEDVTELRVNANCSKESAKHDQSRHRSQCRVVLAHA